VVERRFVQNPHAGAERRKGFLVGKWLLSFKPDQVVVKRFHGGTAEALLKEAGVQLIKAKG